MCVNEVDPYLTPFTAGSFSIYPFDSNGIRISKIIDRKWDTLIGQPES